MAFLKNSRRKKDLGIYGVMAKWYDKNTRSSRLNEMNEYANVVSGLADKGASVLEVAPGPGYLSIELARRGFKVTGVELSQDFVEIEKSNAKEANATVDFKQGNASDLPLQDGQFDSIICSDPFKNFKEPLTALNEMYRVLKPNGTALIIDMNHNATKEEFENELNKTGMKGFDRFFVKLSFKTFLKSGAYTRDGFEELIAKTSFPRHEITKSGIGFMVRLDKREANI
ncbi:MAG: class I SAM-dependent methyltransferase [Clostridiales bacterium]|jgi:ubiquinone/menaquinone biosynthesis C-methylase UbiE|nr:class I SAM-dependent methyltransferase [Clostridiales bacterium]